MTSACTLYHIYFYTYMYWNWNMSYFFSLKNFLSKRVKNDVWDTIIHSLLLYCRKLSFEFVWQEIHGWTLNKLNPVAYKFQVLRTMHTHTYIHTCVRAYSYNIHRIKMRVFVKEVHIMSLVFVLHLYAWLCNTNYLSYIIYISTYIYVCKLKTVDPVLIFCKAFVLGSENSLLWRFQQSEMNIFKAERRL